MDVGGEMGWSKDAVIRLGLAIVWVFEGVGGSSLSNISFELLGTTPSSSEGMTPKLRRADAETGSIFRVQ